MNTKSNFRERLNKAIALREDGRAKQDMAILKEARDLLLNMSKDHPDNAEINYQIGIAYDNSGLNNKAIPYYVKSIDQGLSGSDLQRCLFGLKACSAPLSIRIFACGGFST
ncbi:hypothetical protein [Virgibacillus oceani]|uniref:Tetratrico peptide repeat group 5 domain-containing protein n=1 Tax=Virgibacillus oceani TaxID=1479511 RepID=A0A917M6Y7_9BACI|nr:hypothetical protein [Virgibacillus oceani]GGG78972.1 hypothetical protein GCM10011398_25370 [Virgibacillus oceani]